jgi:hypothetical protein
VKHTFEAVQTLRREMELLGRWAAHWTTVLPKCRLSVWRVSGRPRQRRPQTPPVFFWRRSFRVCNRMLWLLQRAHAPRPVAGQAQSSLHVEACDRLRSRPRFRYPNGRRTDSSDSWASQGRESNQGVRCSVPRAPSAQISCRYQSSYPPSRW